MHPTNNNGSLSKSFFESLEDRVLFDGVPDATFVLPQTDAQEPLPAQTQDLTQAGLEGPRELVLIDAGVADSQELLSEILESKPDSTLEIRMLDASSDGVQQITDILAASDGQYDAVHIISHGDEGEVNLGNSALTSENLDQYADQLAGWSDALSSDADLLFYGCELAGNADGEQFLQSISTITGADVAASDDLTGAEAKGGDWVLEVNVGTIEAASLVAKNWNGVLPDTDGDVVDDADDFDDDNDGILDADESPTIGLSVNSDGAGNFTLDGPNGESFMVTQTLTGDFPRNTTEGDNNSGIEIIGDDVTYHVQVTGANAGDEMVHSTDFGGAALSGIRVTVPNAPTRNSDTVIWTINFVALDSTETGTFVDNNSQSTADNTANVFDPSSTAGTPVYAGSIVTDGFSFVLDDDGVLHEAVNPNEEGTLVANTFDFDLILPDGVISLAITGTLANTGADLSFANEVISVDYSNVTTILNFDTDGDGIRDISDPDSDNDGISDLQESGNTLAIAADTNMDGVVDATEAAAAMFTDTDDDGAWDQLGALPIDFDVDGIPNYLDLDSDNDGIPDAVENQPTAGYQSPAIGNDADDDGVVDTFDHQTPSHGGDFGTPEDTDRDGTADYLDTDSDNDGVRDTNESGLTLSGSDNNGDGIDDGVAPNGYQDTDGVISDPTSDMNNETGDTSEVAYREAVADLVTVKTLISGDNTPNEGDVVTFQIEVTNNGDAQATNVSLTDSIPAGFTLTGNTPSQGAYVGGVWNIGTLDDGVTATITLTGTINAGQGGNTITNVTTAATGDQVDPSTVGDDLQESVEVNVVPAPSIGLAKAVTEAFNHEDHFDVSFRLVFENNGNVDLTNLSIFDDIASEFGSSFIDINDVFVQNFVGSGVAPTVNNAWAFDTTQSIITGGRANVGDTFEVVFVVGVDVIAGGFSPLDNQASAQGVGINPDTGLADSSLTAFDDSDNGFDPSGENGEASPDGIFGNDPTPIEIADLAIAKSIVGDALLNDQGFYVVTFQAVVGNTGNVDLAQLSVVEDLSTQFGSAFVDAGNLTIISGPSSVTSNVVLDSPGFDGSGSPQLLDSSVNNVLAYGDSFTIQFEVEIDPTQVSAPLVNQIQGNGLGVNSSGAPILGADGNQLSAQDLSDSGTDPNGINSDDPSDRGTLDDPTLFDPAATPQGTISGVVFQDDNDDGVQDAGEVGIGGVEVILTGTDVYGTAVDVTVFTDANGVYTFDGLVAGDYRLAQTQPLGFDDGIDSGDPSFTVGNDTLSNIQLGFGQAFVNNTFGEVPQSQGDGAAGNPPRLPGFLPPNLPPVGNQAFLGTPRPIYSGIPINQNSDPLALDSGRRVLGGYSVSDGPFTEDDGSFTEGDCGSSAPVDACGNPIMATPVEPINEDDCGCGPVRSVGEIPMGTIDVQSFEPVNEENTDESFEAAAAEEGGSEQKDQADNEIVANKDPDHLAAPYFLKRFSSLIAPIDQIES